MWYLSIVETEINHPSFVVVGLHRSSVSGRGDPLFGSDLFHREMVVLYVQKAYLDNSQVPPRVVPEGQQLIEVRLSELQFAELITTFNRGEGVPGTMAFLKGVGNIKPPPAPRPLDSVQNSFNEAIEEVDERLDKMARLVESTKMSASSRTVLLREIDTIRRRHASTIPYIVEQFTRHVRKIATAAKTEIEAYVTNRFMRIGGRGTEELQTPVRLELPEGDAS